MADYLNPDSMLTPTNAKGSMYAPSYDQMLWADTTRRLQAEEMLKHQNEMSAYEAVERKHKLPAFMAEQQQKLLEAQMKSDPRYLDATMQGHIGQNQSLGAKGTLESALLPGQIDTANAANALQLGNAEFMQDYQRKEQFARTLEGMIKMYPPTPENAAKYVDVIRSHANPKGGWLSGNNMEKLQTFAKNPVDLLRMVNSELDYMRTQEQRFKWNLQDQELNSRERVAQVAAEADKAGRGKDDTWRAANSLSNQAIKYEDSAIKIERMIQAGVIVDPDGKVIDLTKDAATKKELQAQVKRLRDLAYARQSEADRLMGINPMERTPEPSPAPTQGPAKKWNPQTKLWE